MGFNIATARLGRTTQLRSGVEGEERWSIIQIDLNTLQQRQSFRLSPRFEFKRANEHGTRITIGNLRQEQAVQIAAGIGGRTLRSVSGLRNWVGRTYAQYMRDSTPGYYGSRLRILVNSVPAKPYRWCIWGEDRYVEVGPTSRTGEPERIHAFQEFNQLLGGGDYLHDMSGLDAARPTGNPRVLVLWTGDVSRTCPSYEGLDWHSAASPRR